MKDKPEKKRHHYVPVTYLSAFTDNDGKVFAYRKDDARTPLHVKPSEIGFERYYYSQPLPDGGRDNNKLETYFGTIEGQWSRLTARLKSGCEITTSDLENLYTFMGLMRVRVPAARDMVEVLLAEHVKARARSLDQRGLLPPKPFGHEDLLERVTVSIDPHQSLHAMPALAKGFGLVLDQLGFEVLHNETGMSLLTSDNPVIYFDPTVEEAKILPYRVRPPHAAIELLLPIDPNTVLRGRTGIRGIHRVALRSPRDAKRINRYVARFGYRFIFSVDRTHEALITRHADTSPIVRTVTAPDAAGRNFMVMQYEFGRRPTKPKWQR